MRTLKNDSRGTAYWIENEAAGMDPDQLYREFVQNGVEARASRVTIDGWTDPETGRTLARITDNGTGLTHDHLIKHLSTLHVQSKGAAKGNYGVGARIASLAHNPSGVAFASRTEHGEGMVMLHKHRGEYGFKQWTVLDEDGWEVSADLVTPDDGMLDRLDGDETGTTVILYGDGKADTWTSKDSYRVHRFLSQRYYDFAGDVSVYVHDGGKRQSVQPLGESLARHGEADGEIPFRSVGGLDGTMFWWTLPAQQQNIQGRSRVPGGAGLVVDNEIFAYDRRYLGDFGVIYKSVQHRVSILIAVHGARMDTARSGTILPGTVRKSTPWKELGAHFAEHMPPEIDALLSSVSTRSPSLDADLARMLDADWMKNLNPVKVPTPDKDGDPGVGDDEGDANPRGGEQPNIEGEGGSGEPRKKAAAERSSSGSDPAKPKAKVVTPKVDFCDDLDREHHPAMIAWQPAVNTVLIHPDFPPYVREVGRWVEQTPHPRAVVEKAVQDAYKIEFAATIIDANGQAKHGMTVDVVEELKSDAALYAKALGMQSLTERIGERLREVGKTL